MNPPMDLGDAKEHGKASPKLHPFFLFNPKALTRLRLPHKYGIDLTNTLFPGVINPTTASK
jgi:hypothetical protein